MKYVTCELFCFSNKRFFSVKTNMFVPKHTPVQSGDISALNQFVDETNKLLVITGAGISTESGSYLAIRIITI